MAVYIHMACGTSNVGNCCLIGNIQDAMITLLPTCSSAHNLTDKVIDNNDDVVYVHKPEL